MSSDNLINSENMYDDVKLLSFPRVVGSNGQKIAREYIEDSFKKLGLSVERESFSYSIILPRIGRIICILLGSLFLISACMLYLSPLISILIIVFIFLFAWFASGNVVGLIYRLRNVGKIASFENVIGRIRPDKAKAEIVLSAHYDSASLKGNINVKYMVYIALFTSFGIFSLCVSLLVLATIKILFLQASYPQMIFLTVSILSSFLTSLLVILLLVSGEGNNSPGAVDNASGLAVLLELARVFHNNQPRNLCLTFIAFDAEEKGLLGSITHVYRNLGCYDVNTFNLNFDCVGLKGIIELPRETDSWIYGVLTEIAKSHGFQVKRGILPIGIPSDHLPFVKQRLKAASLSVLSKDLFSIIHSNKDNLDVIDKANLKRAAILGYELIKRIDSTYT